MRFLSVIFTVILLAAMISPGLADSTKIVIYDLPDELIEKQLGIRPQLLRSPGAMEDMTEYRFSGDTFRFLVVPVEWSNRPGIYSRETLDSMVFSRNVYPRGSVADYFDEVSYGQIIMVGEVIDWYNAGTYNTNMNMPALLQEIDPLVDYSQFDGDGDGIVDAVMFLRSGTGQEDTHDPDDIWSYAYSWVGYGWGPYDGVMIEAMNTSPELFPMRDLEFPWILTGADTLNRINVICHETSHNMGLPDLYDYDAKLNTSTYSTPSDSNDHPLMDWCLMGYGGYGLFCIHWHTPEHLCGWSKRDLGWVEALPLIGTFNDLVIYNIETHKDSSLYLLPIDPAEGEYFLLEYRNPNSTGIFDKIDSDFSVFFWPDLTGGPDTLDRGLLITHVHENAIPWYETRVNYGWPDYDHYTVAVEDAGYDPSRDYTFNPEGRVTDSAQWWYPYETRRGALFSSETPGQERFGPDTYPSSDGYSSPSGIEVRVDSIVGNKLYAYVYSPNGDADGDGVYEGVDNCPGLYNPNQDDADDDDIGDLCDNCTDVYNPDQANYDTDSLGNACDNCPLLTSLDQTNTDGDIFGDPCDNCPEFYSSNPTDTDGDGWGDVCDNCPETFNPDQIDSDGDDAGDACDYACGDANGDWTINVGDAVFLINYVFKNGAAPVPIYAGDANIDGAVNVGDAVSLINYIFKNGDPPQCPTE